MRNRNSVLLGKIVLITKYMNNSGVISLRCYSLYKTMYCPTKPVDWCQCCMRGIAFTNAEGSSDLLGNYNTPEVVNTAYNTSCFHSISFSFFTNIFVRGEFALLRCPIKSSGLRFPSILSTAATHSGRCIRHWRCSPRSPYFTNYDAIICKRERFILLKAF